MGAFTKLLRTAQRKGKLTVGDLRWWFGRDYHTVREWSIKGREPTGARADEAWQWLEKLIRAIENERDGFPIPVDLTKRERARYMRKLGNGRNRAHARIPAARAARKRVVRRVRETRRAEKAVGNGLT